MSRTFRNTKHASFLRRPKTQGEKKASFAALEDGITVRPKRNAKNLPDTYDDLIVAALSENKERKSLTDGLGME